MDQNKNQEQDLNNMQRRGFVKAITASSIGTAMFGTAAAAPFTGSDNQPSDNKPTQKKKVLMKVGCQSGGTTVENLEFKARHGVYNLDGGTPKEIPGMAGTSRIHSGKKKPVKNMASRSTPIIYHLLLLE